MSLHRNRPICIPGLLLMVVFELIGILIESNIPPFFDIISGFYLIRQRYVLKLIGLSLNGRPKMRKFFEFFKFCQCSSQ